MKAPTRLLVACLSMLTFQAVALAQTPATNNCPHQAFTRDNYDRITIGMSAEEVSAVFQCKPTQQLTKRNAYSVQMSWSTAGKTLKWIQVWFDKEGRSVERMHPNFDFKEKAGF